MFGNRKKTTNTKPTVALPVWDGPDVSPCCQVNPRQEHTLSCDTVTPEQFRAYCGVAAPPTVEVRGDLVDVTTAADGIQTFDRDKLATAWLLRLEHETAPAVAGVLRRDHGFLDAIRYAIAADALVRAGIDPTKEQ
ncbi:hypothetical protein ABZY58_11320 [Micromonospora tulbaghiae]|uniref:hypothetical protein n=1 Tax=Micromonospora tulbaghiae TaxID=479978 RepID=UPI0033A2FE61